MMVLPLDRLLTFAGMAFMLIVIPGPSVLFVISRALAYGRRAALLTVAGGATSWFGRSRRRLDLMGGAAGLTMIGLGVGLALTGRKE